MTRDIRYLDHPGRTGPVPVHLDTTPSSSTFDWEQLP